MERSDFIDKIKKVKEPRIHKVKGSLGVYDAFKWYRKHKPKDKKYILKEVQYFAIIRKINNLLRERLVTGEDIMFPCRMGKLEIRKYPVRITTEGKKVKTNLPIDWDATLKLWYEDEECRLKKTLVKMNVPELYLIYYDKRDANYNNKSFYGFTPNRELKRMLNHNVRHNLDFDAFTF